jgi:hypothetical protein
MPPGLKGLRPVVREAWNPDAQRYRDAQTESLLTSTDAAPRHYRIIEAEMARLRVELGLPPEQIRPPSSPSKAMQSAIERVLSPPSMDSAVTAAGVTAAAVEAAARAAERNKHRRRREDTERFVLLARAEAEYKAALEARGKANANRRKERDVKSSLAAQQQQEQKLGDAE